MTEAPTDSAYIAALWEHPSLCIAFFGVQFQTEEGARLYQESGIEAEVEPEVRKAEGLLLSRGMMTEEGPVLMQYWRCFEDLDRWARVMPHTRWWRWLVDNAGKGVAFYHEIYQVKAAEAIYEVGSRPVGPALFSSLERVPAGKGHSPERQQRFLQVAVAEVSTD